MSWIEEHEHRMIQESSTDEEFMQLQAMYYLAMKPDEDMMGDHPEREKRWMQGYEVGMVIASRVSERERAKLKDYVRSESINHHAQGMQAQCAIEKERHYAAHHVLEKVRAWLEANL